MSNRWQVTLIPMINSTRNTYVNVVSVPTKITNISNHTSPLIPQVVPTHLTLREQRYICYDNVFTSHGRGPRDIPRFSCPRCTIMASRMTDMQPISHDMDYPKQALRG
jgi:hypothetical protein